MQTRYHAAYLTAGCWSPTRCGLFFLTRIDGFLDVWDFYYRQNELAHSVKVSDLPLTSISVNQNLIAVGDSEGTVSLMALCKPLYETSAKEKDMMNQVFDREFRREKSLEIQKKIANDALAKGTKIKDQDSGEAKEQKMKETITQCEEDFFKYVS